MPLAKNTSASSARASGFSLVELMISMTIGLLLLTALAAIFSNSSRTQREVTLSAQQIENGRYAMDLLADDVHHAGYWGYYAGAGTAPGSMPDPCATDTASLTTAMAMPVQGYNAPIATLPTCLASGNYLAGTDVLVVRHASTNVAGALDANRVYIQTSPSGSPIIGNGGTTYNITVRNGTGSNVAAPIRAYEVHIYYVSPCSAPAGSVCASSDDGGHPIPTLKRLELSIDGSGAVNMVTVPLVEGIENFQVDYGLDTNGDGSPDTASFTADPGSIPAWMQVMTLQAYVLARNTQASTGYTDNKSYILGTAGTITPTGTATQYRRHVYASVLRLTNPSERLETP